MLRALRDSVGRRLARAPRWQCAAFTTALIALVGATDWFTGVGITLTLAYLLPIAIAAWFLGRIATLATPIVCAATWLAIDIARHGYDTRHPAVLLLNLTLQLVIFVLFSLLLAEVRSRLDLEERLARTDPLTGVGNRRAFWGAAAAELERCRRFGQPFSIAYLDIDGFKDVNDRLGHQRGDELLRAVGQTAGSVIRRVDAVARLGGDEFALLLPGTEAAGARVVIDRLRERLIAVGGRAAPGIGFSIGCLTVHEAPAGVDDLIARADALMYAVKATGTGGLAHEVLGPSPEQRTPQASS